MKKALELLKADRDFCLSINNDKSIIQQYDEAIDELEKYLNRSCYNCKYILDTETEGSFCKYNDRCSDEGISVDYVRNIEDFYCKRWSSK